MTLETLQPVRYTQTKHPTAPMNRRVGVRVGKGRKGSSGMSEHTAGNAAHVHSASVRTSITAGMHSSSRACVCLPASIHVLYSLRLRPCPRGGANKEEEKSLHSALRVTAPAGTMHTGHTPDYYTLFMITHTL